ncbi:endonuclease-reverse transcriptase, partial [Elysia marginata]
MKKTSKIFFMSGYLQAELSEIPRHDVITLIGDLNAEVGDENIGAERTMGIHGCGSINNNCERLVELCTSNDLVIGGTLFEHPAIHKLTWYSPNGRDKNQIDHIAINNIWRRSLLDVRVKRGADVGSDHLLVIASIRLKLRRTDRRDMHKKRLDLNKLKDPDVRKLFTIQLKNRFQALSEQENNSPQEMENINHLWNQVKTSYQDAGQWTLGHRKARWTEHFHEILNRQAPESESIIPEAEEDLDVVTTVPTRQEIIRAIKSLKNNKAPGPDGLNAELFKADPELAAGVLLPLLTNAWKEKKIPEEWNEGFIIKIPKKGNLSDCNNWRGITLLSIPSKVLAKIVIGRISGAIDRKLREEQAGFRPGRGRTDQIFTLRNII